MREDLIVQRVREGIEKRGKLPAAERLQDMRDRGVIDKDGKVLLRMPAHRRRGAPSMTTRSAKDGSMTSRTDAGEEKRLAESPVSAITIIDEPSIKIIDGIPSSYEGDRKEYRWPPLCLVRSWA